ncbi:asparaginase [Saccharothrix longispora]|uniref:L-asparaginase n=1 Tax=Saccharothrix longispora TaxID=33920 RepID=A0ABU1PP89_9PSEU|nr:asparaginase [Saccharothrix longispora]MDR6592487.1 L-asparaginase [Saccharothrix longispora]
MPSLQRAARVTVIGLGGTIAMTTTQGGGVVPALSAEQLMAAVPGLADTGIDVEVVDFRQVPGASLTFTDLTALADEIRERCAAGVDGVVVIQGTDTIEETSYFLDLRHDTAQPVVVTGAMRNPTLAGPDGPANLLAAIRTAAHPTARDLGCLVVFADEIHAAHRVRKTHTTSGSTFQSTNAGPLGYLVEGHPRILNRPPDRPLLPALGADTPADVRVGLVTATLGDGGELLHGLAEHLDGLVVAAFGVGHVPAIWVAPLQHLATRIPVVLASRTGSGPVLAQTYAFPGSERDLLDHGLIRAGFLDPLKARILLHRLLTAGADTTAISTAFHTAGGYDAPANTADDRPAPTTATR